MTRAHLEALLFMSAKPLTRKQARALLECDAEQLATWVEELAARYEDDTCGVRLVTNGEELQLMTAPSCRALAEQFLKEEVTGELTRPQLETLTIIAYRGPVSKPDIEQIRGINCTLIVRNLLWRGLIEEAEGSTTEIPVYRVTMDFVRYLGLSSVKQLPDFESLHVCDISSPLLPSPQPSA